MSNFFGFPKPRKAGFGSPDIPSGDVPLDTADEDVVLEGVIVDFGEADSVPTFKGYNDLPEYKEFLESDEDVQAGNTAHTFDRWDVNTQVGGEDIKTFLRRMMGADVLETKKDDFSGTFLVSSENEEPAETTPEPTVESAESVADMLNVMGNENEKLEHFIADAMKNIKK